MNWLGDVIESTSPIPVTAPNQPISRFAQDMHRRWGKLGRLGGRKNFGVQLAPASSVLQTYPLLLTSHPVSSSKNQISSVREFATGEFCNNCHWYLVTGAKAAFAMGKTPFDCVSDFGDR